MRNRCEDPQVDGMDPVRELILRQRQNQRQLRAKRTIVFLRDLSILGVLAAALWSLVK